MKHCRCEKPRVPNDPRRTSCNRCGFRIPEPQPPAPIIHHCARCLTDLRPEDACGRFWMVEQGGVAKWLHRFCPTCAEDILEYAVSYRDPSDRHAA